MFLRKEGPLTTHMLREALEAPDAVARQLALNDRLYREFGAHLREHPPQSILTLARGSSDNAAHFMAYLIMARLGRLVTSLPMSLLTLYQSPMACEGVLSLAFSQSGQSPDLVEPTRFFSDGAACTAAFVNHPESPLALSAQWVFPLHAGAETSVAATKSFINQLAAGASLVACWQQDEALQRALATLPEVLTRAADADWSAGLATLSKTERLFVIGRGPGLSVALEAALKFKETCGIQAEAFSGAEIMHGPMALIDEDYPLLILALRGPAQVGLLALADQMRERGARVLLAAPEGTPHVNLPIAPTASPDLDPISAIQSFYPMVEALAHERGMNPDKPPYLAKVTRTH